MAIASVDGKVDCMERGALLQKMKTLKRQGMVTPKAKAEWDREIAARFNLPKFAAL
jgi:hypothetical protein